MIPLNCSVFSAISVNRVSIALLSLGLIACGGANGRHSLDAIARDYVRLAIALGEHDPDAIDYNIAPPGKSSEKTPGLREIAQQARDAESRLQTLPETASERGRFLAGQLHAVAARADMLLGKRESFDAETRSLFGFTNPASSSNMNSIRAQLNERIPGAKPLAERIAAFEAGATIRPERLSAVIDAALAACRAQTLSHLALPAGEKVSVEYVSNQPWSAYSTYKGDYRSLIRVNLDLPLTVDAALDLACHEGYPGHHVFNSLVDENLIRAGGREEFRVQPTFSPQSLVSEAAAGVASEMAFPPDERLRVEKDTLYPLAGLDASHAEAQIEIRRLLDSLSPEEFTIARDYIDGNLEFARAASALEDRALMAGTDATLRYLNEFRTYAVTYTSGRDSMRRWMESYPGGAWPALVQLTKHPIFPANPPVTAGGG